MQDDIKKSGFISGQNFFLAVLFLSGTALTVEIALQIFGGTSLCGVSDCKVAGEYIRFGETVLVQAGAVFFWLFFLLAFLAVRYPSVTFWQFAVLASLYGSVAFDGALLGFQFLQLKLFCKICAGVGVALLLTAISFACWKKSWRIFLLSLVVWISGFMANGLLLWSDTGEIAKLEQSILIKIENSIGDYPKYHFFFSLHCGHCEDLLTDFSVNNDLLTENGNWYFHPVDLEQDDIAKLSLLPEIPEVKNNIFYAILKVKQMQYRNLPMPEKKFFTVGKKAQAFFMAGGYSGIPLMIVRINPSVTLAFQGNEAIMKWLSGQKLIKRLAVRDSQRKK